MVVTFEPVTVDSSFGDSEGMMALRDGRLFAILTRLGDLHNEYAGEWFVEASFVDWIPVGERCATLPNFADHAKTVLAKVME